MDAGAHVASGTGLWTALGYGALAILTVVSLGTFLGLLLLGWIIERIMSSRTMAHVRGSMLAIGPAQLPELHAAANAMARRLGLKESPELYVMESAVLNAYAMRIGARKSVILNDDVVWGSVEHGIPDALRFILAHELAHHALGHTSTIRAALRQTIPPLSRLDEFSADAVALQLVAKKEAAFEGITLLAVGPQMYKYVNLEELQRQASRVAADKHTKKAERALTHPLLLHRLARVRDQQVH